MRSSNLAVQGTTTIEQLSRPLLVYLQDPEVTELRVRPGEVVTVTFRAKTHHKVETLTHQYLKALALALVTYSGNQVSPVNYVSLPTGERVTVVQPPALTIGEILVVIRKHTLVTKSLADLEAEGAFASALDLSFNRPSREEAERELQRADFRRLEPVEVQLLALKREGKWLQFFEEGIKAKRTFAIAGTTGSGKTTLQRSMIEVVPRSEHIATIEDVHELILPNHEEVTHLFYGYGAGRITATECLATCMRITPERIFLAELRGGEAWEYTHSLNTDHRGGITTVHANGAIECFDRIATLVKNSDVGRTLEMEMIKHVLYTAIDVVLYMRERKVMQVFYDPMFKRQQLA